MNLIKAIIREQALNNFEVGDTVEVVEVFDADEYRGRAKYLGMQLEVNYVTPIRCIVCDNRRCRLTNKKNVITGRIKGSSEVGSGICSCYCRMKKVLIEE